MTDEYCVGTQRLARTNDQEDVETADNVVDRAQIEALMHETKVSIGASDDEIIDARTMAVVVRYVKLSSKRGISGIIVCVPRLCACHRPFLTHARRRRVPDLRRMGVGSRGDGSLLKLTSRSLLDCGKISAPIERRATWRESCVRKAH